MATSALQEMVDGPQVARRRWGGKAGDGAGAAGEIRRFLGGVRLHDVGSAREWLRACVEFERCSEHRDDCLEKGVILKRRGSDNGAMQA